jgi:hypothetical protein
MRGSVFVLPFGFFNIKRLRKNKQKQIAITGSHIRLMEKRGFFFGSGYKTGVKRKHLNRVFDEEAD